MNESEVTRFPISFDRVSRLLFSALLLSPSGAYIEVGPIEISVRMGWAFRAVFPRAAVESASESRINPLSRGVHGFAGQWLVNGAGQGIVNIALAPSQRAYVVGFPIKLRQLMVSVAEPAALTRSLRATA